MSAELFVLPCGAVVSKGGDMIKVGHYLQYCVPNPSLNEVSSSYHQICNYHFINIAAYNLLDCWLLSSQGSSGVSE